LFYCPSKLTLMGGRASCPLLLLRLFLSKLKPDSGLFTFMQKIDWDEAERNWGWRRGLTDGGS
jgi:hypothetical protein